MMKKILSGVLLVVMTLSVCVPGGVPKVVMASENEVTEVVGVIEDEESDIEIVKEYADAYTSGDFSYVLNQNDEATITGYTNGDAETVVIPSVIDGHTVTGVANNAFNVDDIEYAMKSIQIPASVRSFGYNFYDCQNLAEFILEEGNLYYKVVDGVLFTEDEKRLVAFPPGKTVSEYTVPEGVVMICDYSFERCEKLNKVIIPDGVETIGNCAFQNCSALKRVILGSDVSSIGEYAFYDTTALERIEMPGSLVSIGAHAFRNSGLEYVEIGCNVETIGMYAFYQCSKITEITISASVTSIGVNAFTRCSKLNKINVEEGNSAFKILNNSLVTIDGKQLMAYPLGRKDLQYVVPEGVETICTEAFYGASMENIELPYGLKVIEDSAFGFCMNLKGVELPHTVAMLGSEAFRWCQSMEALVLSGSIYCLYPFTFENCINLKRVFIPSGVKFIYGNAFIYCNNIEEIYYVGHEEDWNSINVESGNAHLANAQKHYLGNLKDFVDRLYTVALGRNYDKVGLNGWVQLLIEETHDGAGLAKEFILGQEFALRNLSDEQYVDVLYTTFFNREADATGKGLWVNALASGATREYVLSQFVNLDEFTILCGEYNINRGVMFVDGSVAAPGLPQFIGRLYNEVLSRGADGEGLYNWTVALATGTVSAEEAAVNFFTSEEYALKNTDSETFVTDLYSVFMDRAADAEGLSFWVTCLEDAGVSRQWVISEFAKSDEFKIIAANYGL